MKFSVFKGSRKSSEDLFPATKLHNTFKTGFERELHFLCWNVCSFSRSHYLNENNAVKLKFFLTSVHADNYLLCH